MTFKRKTMTSHDSAVLRAQSYWFDRFSMKAHQTPEVLKPYFRTRHYLSTKQMPSALSLRKSGSGSVYRERDKLSTQGFPLVRVLDGGETSSDLSLCGLVEASGGDKSSLRLSELLSTSRKTPRDYESVSGLMEDWEEEDKHFSFTKVAPEQSFTSDFVKPGTVRLRIDYEDPFKLFAALVWAELTGRKPPPITVWGGDNRRIQDKLEPWLYGPELSSAKHKVRLADVSNASAVRHFLWNHTHWGYKLRELASDKESKHYPFACTLFSRIKSFLAGKTDPLWSKEQRSRYLVDPDEVRTQQHRIKRLIEVLKTVDGIFLSRFLAYPEEVWTWHKFDMFVLAGIFHLIGDEFLDGELTEEGSLYVSAYGSLKESRKNFKGASHREKLPSNPKEIATVPWVCTLLGPAWMAAKREEGPRYAFVIGLLSQTRGAGTPPPVVTLQSKIKFLQTVTADPRPLNNVEKWLVSSAARNLLEKLPADAFTGLSTKGKVTVTGSASWEHTRSQGGTLQAVADMICHFDLDHPVPVRDLTSGKVTCSKIKMQFHTVGEFIFWAALDQVMKTPPEVLRQVHLTVVREPGKARTVTKGRACLKIVLDFVSKICSWPLKKGLESSESGMGKSHHAWNSFQRMMSDGMRDTVFSKLEKSVLDFGDFQEVTEVYHDIYQSSTDYSCATDALEHDVARRLGSIWMKKCGIPPLLQGIVLGVCYQPREVYFSATGVLRQIGEKVKPDLNKVLLTRGVPMGDPLTKPVLHLVNALTREVSTGLYDGSVLPTSRQATALRRLRDGLTDRK